MTVPAYRLVSNIFALGAQEWPHDASSNGGGGRWRRLPPAEGLFARSDAARLDTSVQHVPAAVNRQHLRGPTPVEMRIWTFTQEVCIFTRMSASEMTLTTFLRHSGDALETVDSRDIRLQRRDGEDLYLKRADREEAEHESLSAAGQILARTIALLESHEALGLAALATVVEAGLPWSRFLPEEDRTRFVREFAETIEASSSVENFGPVGTLLRQWKNTAEVWASPELLAAVRDAELEEGDVVERPQRGE